MKLVILAGGKGARLHPLTENMPKPMIDLVGKPVLQHNIEWARRQSIKDIVICSGYKHEVIENYFGNGSRFGVKITHSVENEPLGTGGALHLIKDYLNHDDFIVLNGDVVCMMDFKKLLSYHSNKMADATIVVHDSYHPEDSDLVEFAGSGEVKKFWLRPHKDTPQTKKSVAGAYVFDSRVLNEIPEGESSLEKQLLPSLYSKGYFVYCYDTNEYLKDMGTFERMRDIESDLVNF